jgi:hypothetical protein
MTVDWSQFQATGFEQTTTDDLGIPFLSILQSKSPEVDESNPEYKIYGIEGARVGDIINTLSREVLWSPKGERPPVRFVPCFHQKLFVEWIPRTQGGGIVKSHNNPAILMETTRNERGLDVLKNGHIIVTTSYFFGFTMSDEGPVKACIGLSSTQLKKAKLWLNLMMAIKVITPSGAKITPPMFSHQYALTTIPGSNDKGSWYGWRIETSGVLQNKELVASAAEFSRQMCVQQQRLIAAPKPADDEIPV